MYGSTWPFLFTYGPHDMRHTGFRRLTVVNETPRIWGVTAAKTCYSAAKSGSLRQRLSLVAHQCKISFHKGS